MSKAIVRRVELFALHAQMTPPQEIDYEKMLLDLQRLDPPTRTFRRNESAFAIGNLRRSGDKFSFQVYEGPIGVSPLIFALDSATAHTSTLERDEIVAEITHVIVDASSRRAAIEYVRRGAKADAISAVIASILAREYRKWRSLDIELAPVITAEFLSLIATFARIREADITITRPNMSWTDHYMKMNKLLQDSNGDNVDLSVRAGRGKSLTQNAGIIQIVKDVVSDEQPYLKRASIRGTRKGEEGETTLSTNKHITHAVSRISQDSNGRLSSAQLQELMNSLLDSNPTPANDGAPRARARG